ncbi:MAG: LCP family protein [Eubacterium sp.]|nr:LCP family protein [Eubacterium sp.]
MRYEDENKRSRKTGGGISYRASDRRSRRKPVRRQRPVKEPVRERGIDPGTDYGFEPGSDLYGDRAADTYRQPERTSVSAPAGKRPARPTGKKTGRKRKSGCLGWVLFFLALAVAVVSFTIFALNHAFSGMENKPVEESRLALNSKDPNMDKYQNIVLFGVDDQDNQIHDIGSRTDSIMIASIHKRTKAVKLLSIYRDTYVSIDGQYDKINAAYSYGGPEMAIRTINRNLDLDVSDYVTVNFKSLADAVDILGGVTLTIESEDELKNLNDYIGNMNKINGGNSPKFDAPGTYTFDGNQAVAYSRIRYMAGGDHARASHQRLVVEAIMKGAKSKPWKAGELISTVLPQCRTSLSENELTRMSMALFLYNTSDSQAYPFDSSDNRYGGIYYGFPLTVESNVKKAHAYLFGTEDYEPCDELLKISQKVKYVTDDLGLTQ